MLTSCQVNPHHFSARVVDFGLARSSSPVDRVTQNMYGTVTHMAPELMAGASAGPVSNLFVTRMNRKCCHHFVSVTLRSWLVDAFVSLVLSTQCCVTLAGVCLTVSSAALQAADVYSFGVLLWEMLTSTRAWAGLQHARVMCMVGMLRQSLAIPEGPPQALKSLLGQCLNADPSARPSFAEISQLLSIYLQESWCERHAVSKNSSHVAGLHREEALHQSVPAG